ncbi:MBG domain-containing protein [Levilactobacillus paucivorans]|uniref:MBG domain-containing protein n=1 Tax=Levilactobacillus paucivorans TaxID=616990 RepID=UPI00070A5F07|nr:MBG domain-containing protein [Levilactobacillus paucivorans]
MRQKAANQTIKQPIAMYKGHTGWKVKTRVFGSLLISLSAVAIAQSTGVTEAHAATPETATSSVQQKPAASQPATPKPTTVSATADTKPVTASIVADAQPAAKTTPVAESAAVDTADKSGDYPVLSQNQSINVGADTTQVDLSADQIANHFTATVEDRDGSDNDSDPKDNTHTQTIGSDGSVTLTTMGSHEYYSSAGHSTNVTGHQAAHVSFEHEIDFSHNFSMSGALGAGSNTSSGADSVGFIFAPGDPAKATQGGSGGQLGLKGLDNAFGFIFDEYYNSNFNDPSSSPYIGWRYTDASGDLQSASSSDWVAASKFGLSRTSTPDNSFVMNYDAGTQMLTVELNNRPDLTLSRKITDISTGYSLSVSASTGGQLNDYSAKIDKFSYTPKTIPLAVNLVDEAKGESAAGLNNVNVNAIANIGDTISIFSTQDAAKRAVAADPTLDPSLIAIIPSDSAGNVYVIDGGQVVANNNGTVHTIADASGKTVADSTYYSYTVQDGDGQSMTVPVRLAFTAKVTPIDATTKQPIEGVAPVTVVAVDGEPVLVSFPGYTPTQMVIAAPTDGQAEAEANLPINVAKTGDTSTTTTDEANPIGHYYTATGTTVDGQPVSVTVKVGTGESIADALNAQGLTNGGKAITSGGKTGIDSADYTWSTVGNAAATDATDANAAQASGSVLVPTQATLAYWDNQATVNQNTAESYRTRAQKLYDGFVGLSGLTDAQKASADKLLASVVDIYTQISDTNAKAKASFESAEAETVPATIYQDGQDGYASLEAVKNLLVSFEGDLTNLTTTNKDAQDSLATFDSWTQTYGDSLGFPKVTFGPDFGAVADDALKGLNNPAYYYYVDARNPDIQVQTPKNAGKYLFNLTEQGRKYLKGLSGSANAGLYVSAMLTINPLATTETVNDATMVYGGDKGQLPTFTGSLGNAAADHTFSQTDFEVVDSTGATVSVNKLQAGGTYTIRYTKGAQDQLSADANYTFAPFGTGKLMVTRRAITVTASPKVKTYGDKDPQLDLTTDSSLGLVNGDQIADLKVTLKRVDDENAGTYQISLDHADTTNYTVTVTPGTFTIAKKNITVQIGSDTRTYGTPDPDLTFSIPTTVDGHDNETASGETSDALKVTLTRAADEDQEASENVGQHAITGTGADDSNYHVTFEDGVDTITAADASVTADNVTMVYGETPTFSAKTNVAGPKIDALKQTDFEIYDTVAKKIVTADQVQAKGTYDISLTADAQVKLATNNPNYHFTSFNNGQLTVTQRPVTMNVTSAEKTYGDDDPTLSWTIDPTTTLGNGDQAADLGIKLARKTGEDVGMYKIDLDGQSGLNSNYQIKVNPEFLTINKKAITVKIKDDNIIFGALAPKPTFSILTDKGLVGEDTPDSLGVTLTPATETNVGSHDITGTADSKNYQVTVEKGTLTISQADRAVSVVAAKMVYGDGYPTFTVTAAVAGPKLDGLSQGDFEIIDEATKKAVTAEKVQVNGQYRIQLTAAAQTALAKANPNYHFTSIGPAKLIVDPRPVTVNIQSIDKTYGDNDPAWNWTMDPTTLGNSDKATDLRITLTRNKGENVGTYAIMIADQDALNKNYTIAANLGNLKINQRQVTVQINKATKIFGDKDPQLSFTILSDGGELPRGDAASSLGVSLTRQAGENVGDYDITGTALNDKNYKVTVEGSTFSVTPASGSVTINDVTATYGDMPVFKGTLNAGGTSSFDDHQGYFEVLNLANNQVVSAHDVQAGGKYRIQLTATAQKTLSDNNPNYTFTNPNWATLTVNKRPVTIQITPQEKYAGDQNPENAMTVVPTSKPLKTGDLLDLTYTEDPEPAVGVTKIDATSANPNYDVTVLPGTLTVLGKDVAKDGTVTIVEKDQESHVIKVTKQWPDGKQTVYTFDPDTGIKTVTESDIKSGRSDIPQKIASSETSATLPDGNGGATVITFNDTDMPDFTHYGPDPDHDGISSEDELKAGTNPTSADTDGDGVSDGDELKAGTNPLSADTDGDGVSDGDELKAGTNPLSADTDGDGVSDGDELKAGTDPLSADTDGDGVSDGDELKAGTDPLSADTDGDGVSDGDELKAGTDPLSADTDGDGVSDGDEVKAGTDPLKADTDGDGVSDGEEIKLGTNPLKADTDGDGVSDGEEIKLGTNPLKADTDGDGLSDGEELKNHTNPLKPDTDGDGINDSDEIRHHTNPLRAESRQTHSMKQPGHTVMRHAKQWQSIQASRKQMTLPQTSQKDESFLAILGAILLSGLLLPFTYKRH